MSESQDIPDFIQFGGWGSALLKATPSEDGGRRYLFMEASNEDVDRDGEVVLQKALADSADFYLRHGNVDISHFTIRGPKMGMADYMQYEIGRPLDVRLDGRRTFVKCELYRGDSPMARNANLVWDSLTRQSPPARWYPSVGGSVVSASKRMHPMTKAMTAVVDKVIWNNLALDRCPVNATVPEVSSVPIGVFQKSMGGFVLKGLTAGYGTDSAALTGGAAIRQQSLDHRVHSYFDFRDRAAEHLLARKGKNPGTSDLLDFAKSLGLSDDESAEFVERFCTTSSRVGAIRRLIHVSAVAR